MNLNYAKVGVGLASNLEPKHSSKTATRSFTSLKLSTLVLAVWSLSLLYANVSNLSPEEKNNLEEKVLLLQMENSKALESLAKVVGANRNQTVKTAESKVSVFAKEGEHLPQIDRVYVCGYNQRQLFDGVFPEYSDVPSKQLTRKSVANATAKDLIINGLGGYCDGWRKKKMLPYWMSKNFPGKAIHFNGEPFGGDMWEQGAPHPRQYHIGYVKDSPQSIRVPFLAMTLNKDQRLLLLDESKKPRGTRSEFMIYIASNCKDFREEAAGRLSEISMIHYGGVCQGKINITSADNNSTISAHNNSTINRRSSSKTPYGIKKGNHNYNLNTEVYSHYRFCLVMENTKLDGYITEKIMLAFVGGCIPVYWGTREIFDLFNERAFIYYDIDDPIPAINRIVYLESNRTAYDQVMNETILKNYNQYLSIDDVVGDGSIKKKIRNTVFPPSLIAER